jgi:hypothetical protein
LKIICYCGVQTISAILFVRNKCKEKEERVWEKEDGKRGDMKRGDRNRMKRG